MTFVTHRGTVKVGDEIELRGAHPWSKRVRAVVGQVTPTREGTRIRVSQIAHAPSSLPRRAAPWLLGLAPLVGVASLLWFLAIRPPLARSAAGTPGDATSALEGRPGPWGKLTYTRIDIEPPQETIRALRAEAPQWFFKERSREDVLAALRRADLEPEAIEQCASRGRWESGPNGTVLAPPLGVVLAMPSGARTKLYRVLAGVGENGTQKNPIPISPDLIEEMTGSGLPTGAIDRFKGLLYGDGPWRLFADLPAMLSTLPDTGERTRLTTFILRAESYVIRLKVDGKTDVDALAGYWGFTDRWQDMRPFIESLTRVPGGTDAGVLRFLPSFVRSHANRYPRADDRVESRSDCFWTALNFDGRNPEAPVDDPEFVVQALKSRFRPTRAQPKVGNLVVLLNGDGAPVHAAVYLADEMVFTKNGRGALHPWTFMTLASMTDLYTTLAGKLRVVFLTDAVAQETRPALN